MTEKKRPSIAEILAAARKQDSAGAKGGEPTEAAASTPPAVSEEVQASEAPVEAAPAEIAASAPEEPAKPAAPSKPAAVKPAGGRMSVAEMMAAARAEKAGGGAPAAKPAPAAAAPVAAVATPTESPKPAAAVAAKGPAGPAAKAAAGAKPAAPAEKPAPSGAKDTGSILAAARSTAKPGPMSKAEAAKKADEIVVSKSTTKLVVPPMPVKPEAAKVPTQVKKAEVEERRGMMALLFGSFLAIGFSTLSATMGLWTLGLARFMFPNILTEPPSKFKVGFPTDFPPGVVEEKFKALFGVWVVNTDYNGARQIVALRTVCTHLGCTPNWLEGEQKFKCPCHGSGFYKDGINFEGPAPRPLERYAIRLADDGQLEVDKSKLFQEELGQWADSACFVAV